MTLNFFLVGKPHATHFIDSYEYYRKRILKYANVNISFLKEEKLPDRPSQGQIAKALEIEGHTIEKNLPKNTYLILLDLNGKESDSLEFSEEFKDISEMNTSISFVIGSSYGLGDNIKARANYKWKMSRLTFTHPMALEIALEQVYRAIKISKGETYQK